MDAVAAARREREDVLRDPLRPEPGEQHLRPRGGDRPPDLRVPEVRPPEQQHAAPAEQAPHPTHPGRLGVPDARGHRHVARGNQPQRPERQPQVEDAHA
jgi:hypothetical protein